MRHHFISLEYARAVAAISVLLLHTAIAYAATNLLIPTPLSSDALLALGGWEIHLIWLGRHAVSLFFVLSGFILSYHYQSQAFNLRDYITHRILRIYPMLFFTVAAGAAIFHGDYTLSQLSTIFLPQIIGINTLNLGIMGWVLWSIPLELLMYCLLPLYLGLIKNDGDKAIINLLVALNVVLLIGSHMMPDMFRMTYHSALARGIEFLCGVYAGSFLARNREYQATNGIIALGAAIITIEFMILITQFGSWDSKAMWIAFLPLCNGIIFARMLLITATTKLLRMKWLAYIGKISFSVYLLHGLVIQLLLQWGWKIEIPGQFTLSLLLTGILLVLPITLLLSTITYHAVEAPFLKLKKRAVL